MVYSNSALFLNKRDREVFGLNSVEKKTFGSDVSTVSKGFAVIFMLIHHLFSCNDECYEKFGVFSYLLSTNDINKISVVFKICVAIFVFISAYGMTVAMRNVTSKAEMEQSAIKRYKKLMFNYIFIYVLCIVTCFLRKDFLNIYWEEGFLKGILYMIIDAAGLAHFLGTPTYNETWWYMSLAILLIFAIPIFEKLYDKFGICTVVFSAMLPYCIDTTPRLTKYMFVIFLAIWVCKESVFHKLGSKIRYKWLAVIADILCIYILCLVRLKMGFTYWVDALIAAMLVFGVYLLVDEMHLKLSVLKLLGRHSMNMFLLHTIIYKYYFEKFIYSFEHWLLISGVLIIETLILSIVIEKIKNFVGKIIHLQFKMSQG